MAHILENKHAIFHRHYCALKLAQQCRHSAAQQCTSELRACVVMWCMSRDDQESILQYSPSRRVCVAENVRNELWQNVERSVQMNDILHHFGYTCVGCVGFVC